MILNVSLSGFSPSSALELFDLQRLRYEVDHLLRPNVKSKQKPCFISCRTFLDLALTLHKPDGFKLDNIRKLLDSGQKLQSIPMLYTLESEYSKSSTIHVVGHEGRHRALVCLERGYEYMPLMLHGCRWSIN